MYHNEVPPWFIFSLLFALGAMIGSFLNVCVYRIPLHERLWDQLKSVCDGRSYCPKCKHGIRWYDNVPIIGWLRLRGRCRDCRGAISWRYPTIELLNALLFVFVYWCEVPVGFGVKIEDGCLFSSFGPQVHPGLGGWSPNAFMHLRYIYHMVLIEALLVASLIDIDLRVIPDASTLPAMAIGILGGAIFGRVHLLPAALQDGRLVRDFRILIPDWLEPLLLGDLSQAPGSKVPEWVNAHPHLHGLMASVAGAVVGAGAIWLLRIMGRWVLRREAMGFGDVILMGLIGSYLGWQATLIAFFVAPACAIVVVTAKFFFHREQELPYGPYLSLGALITLLAFGPLWNYSSRIFQLGVLLLPLACVMGLLFLVTLALLQGVKKLFGWDWSDDPAPVIEWSAADQNQYTAGENVDRQQGRWPTDSDWSGTPASRGTGFEEQWRSGG